MSAIVLLASNRNEADGWCAGSSALARHMRSGLRTLHHNYLFLGNERSGHDFAALYTLVASCEKNGVNAIAYLTDVLIRVQHHPARDIEELLPRSPYPRRTFVCPAADTDASNPATAIRASGVRRLAAIDHVDHPERGASSLHQRVAPAPSSGSPCTAAEAC